MSESRFSRQSFLGPLSQETIESTVIGIVGLGGGGSHIVQQLAHVGFLHYAIFDPDTVEGTNLNRLVGARESDIGTAKVQVAERVIKGLRPQALVEAYEKRWQEVPETLRGCDLIFGCVDGLQGREELERISRRYLLPYIDIGMDVHCLEGEAPRMAGQVILSLPGCPCMKCLGFLRDDLLKREGERYGDAGGQPQVVWPNGVLASAAVGVAVDLLTGWTRKPQWPVYLSYNGNDGTLTPHVRLRYLPSSPCPHYPASHVGDPIL